jgi:hypothetical protein
MKIRTIVAAFILLLGLIQYFYNRNFWIDEAMLAINVTKLDFFELLKPLKYYNQVAPIGLLMISKVMITLFGTSDIIFRLPMILSFAMIVFLVWKKSDMFKLTGLLLLFNFMMIYYSSEYKQYIFDVLLVFLLLVALKQKKFERGIFILILFTYFSSLTMVALVPFYVVMILSLYKDKVVLSQMKNIFSLTMILALVLISYYFAFIHDHPTKEYMVQYHAARHGLYNQNVFAYFKIILETFSEFIVIKHYFTRSTLLTWIVEISFFSLTFFLLIMQCLLKRPLAIFIALLFTMHVLFSFFRLYPIGGRFSVYFVVFVVYLYSDIPLKRAYFKIINTILIITGIPFLAMNHPTKFPFHPLDYSGILRSRSIQDITENPSTTLYFRSNEFVEFSEPVWKYYNPDKTIVFLSMEDSIKHGNGKYYILQKKQIDPIQFPHQEVTKMEEILSRNTDPYLLYSIRPVSSVR